MIFLIYQILAIDLKGSRHIDGKININGQIYNNLNYVLELINDNYNIQLNQHND